MRKMKNSGSLSIILFILSLVIVAFVLFPNFLKALDKDLKNKKSKVKNKLNANVSNNIEVATLGGGCFWCTEAVMEKLTGVKNVVSGYMGGTLKNPTYKDILKKNTGHIEVINVEFDKTKISFSEILNVFWQAHDPTTWDQQGADKGPQYRSVIFYHSNEQEKIAKESKKKLDLSKVYKDPAVTVIRKADTFWEAEAYHQNYYRSNKNKNPYCRVVISPKLKKLGLEDK